MNLPEGVAIAPLESADADWPQAEYRTKDLRFRGYYLDKRQRPTFGLFLRAGRRERRG